MIRAVLDLSAYGKEVSLSWCHVACPFGGWARTGLVGGSSSSSFEAVGRIHTCGEEGGIVCYGVDGVDVPVVMIGVVTLSDAANVKLNNITRARHVPVCSAA